MTLVKPRIKKLEPGEAVALIREADFTFKRSELKGTEVRKVDWPGFQDSLWLHFSGERGPNGKPLVQELQIGQLNNATAFCRFGDFHFELRSILRVENNGKRLQNMLVPLEKWTRGREGNIPVMLDFAKTALKSYLEATEYRGNASALADELCEKRSRWTPKRQDISVPVPHNLAVMQDKRSVHMFYDAPRIDISSNPLGGALNQFRIQIIDYIKLVNIQISGWGQREEELGTRVLNDTAAKIKPDFKLLS
ncbi:MAG: hypothetical protein KGH94_04065 [Candidatus Micrarchaeota archaeon]|nr:hypothetical protein [Candidatus Micrarchaeota archaeon]